MLKYIALGGTNVQGFALDQNELDELYVQFHNNSGPSWYKYMDVEPETILKVMFSESIGKAFNTLIKNGDYPYLRVEPDDLPEITA